MGKKNFTVSMPSVRGKNHLQALKCEPDKQGGQEAGAEQSSEGSN